jgi:hypothetical protein
MASRPSKGGIGIDCKVRSNLAKHMERFDLNDIFQAECLILEEVRIAEVYYLARNSAGRGHTTPVARFFVWRPVFIEGFNPYWRVDCFVRQHQLSPQPMLLGDVLVIALVRERLCAEPIWTSAHRSDELEGRAYGDVFSDD